MKASLDTNVIIHLYEANYQHILFDSFEEIYVYEFIRTQEMNKHASRNTISLFDADVDSNKIIIVNEEYFKSIGMNNVFLQHVKDLKILYEPSDLGEIFAIALAKTIGCFCIVTDDIKVRGPHYTLMIQPDSDVIPFAFFEILFMCFLESKMTEKEVISAFETISNTSDLNWSIKAKLNFFVRRFWEDVYSDREKVWMCEYCKTNNIEQTKIQKLYKHIK